MNIPSSEEIQADIYKLVGEREKSKLGAEALEESIETLRKEQDELRSLLENPGPYDVDSLHANIVRIDDDVIRIRGVVKLEHDKADHFDYIIEDLEKRKCQSDMISRLTGTPPLES